MGIPEFTKQMRAIIKTDYLSREQKEKHRQEKKLLHTSYLVIYGCTTALCFCVTLVQDLVEQDQAQTILSSVALASTVVLCLLTLKIEKIKEVFELTLYIILVIIIHDKA